jgi:hypothetical protein
MDKAFAWTNDIGVTTHTLPSFSFLFFFKRVTLAEASTLMTWAIYLLFCPPNQTKDSWSRLPAASILVCHWCLVWVDKSDEKMFWSTINMTAAVKILFRK